MLRKGKALKSMQPVEAMNKILPMRFRLQRIVHRHVFTNTEGNKHQHRGNTRTLNHSNSLAALGCRQTGMALSQLSCNFHETLAHSPIKSNIRGQLAQSEQFHQPISHEHPQQPTTNLHSQQI